MFLNKLVGFLMNPLTLGMLMLVAGLVLQIMRRRREAMALTVLAFLWFWAWSMPALYMLLGGRLEKPYPPRLAQDMPTADAIVVLGGGMGCNTNLPYAEMWSAADRVWHAARLYRAGKAPVVIPSGTGEEHATVPLLLDLGVPRKAIRVEKKARNTEENALLVEKLVRGLPGMDKKERPRVLLVTSAWHMRRSLLNFGRTGLEVIPAAADHEAGARWKGSLKAKELLPNIEAWYLNGTMAKEYLGYWLYRGKYLLRPLA